MPSRAHAGSGLRKEAKGNKIIKRKKKKRSGFLHDSLIQKLVYKLVKKYIAGTTITSAIEAAKSFNSKGIPVSLTFLTAPVDTLPKARYVASTYLELIRRIGRFGLKASLQIPIADIGFFISESSARAYLDKILETGNKYGIFVWLELPSNFRDGEYVLNAKGIGYVVHSRSKYDIDFSRKAVKISFIDGLEEEQEAEGKESHKLDAKKKQDEKNILSKDLALVKQMQSKAAYTVLQFAPEKLMHEVVKNSAYKKSLIFEFQLGYEHKYAGLAKKGWRTSVYVPFGKVWLDYAASRLQGHYTRMLVRKLLDGKKV